MGTPLIIFLLVLGIVFVILMMALIINPPEALIKRVYHRNVKPKAATRRNVEVKPDE